MMSWARWQPVSQYQKKTERYALCLFLSLQRVYVEHVGRLEQYSVTGIILASRFVFTRGHLEVLVCPVECNVSLIGVRVLEDGAVDM
jgi:hypothetical protein